MSEPAATLYRGGRIVPMDPARSSAEALVARGGRVAAFGDEAAMASLAGPRAEVVDLGGAVVLPGLIDTHPHLLHFGAFRHPLVDLADAVSHADIVGRIAARARTTAKGAWIMATPVGEPHYFLRRSWRDLAEGSLPGREVLDQASRDHPVMIQAWAPVIPNVCCLNSAGLATLGIDATTPDRIGNVWIDKDPHGAPTGILRGSVNNYYTNEPFMNELLAKVPMLVPEAVVPGTIAAMSEYNRMGVTTVYEGHAMGLAEIGAYQALREADALTVRVLTALEAEPYGLPWSVALDDDQFRANLEQALAMRRTDDDLLRSNGCTLSRGGPCWPGFLRMHEPYRGPYGEPTRGVTFVSAEKEETAIRFCARTGLRLNFIGAGYRDHDEFLDRAERAALEHPIAERRWILQHAYLVTAEQARRYARLGFEVTTSMSFSWGKGELLADRIGRHVWADLIPLRRLLDAGMPVGCGTDWGPKNVFEHIELAETHRFAVSGHENRGPAQSVSRYEAVRMWTSEAARVLDWPGIGSLVPGNQADLVVLDRDPLACELDDLAATQVLRTVVGGRTVYDGGAL